MLKKLTFSVFILLFLGKITFAQNKFLNTITPNHVNLQYAGSIGFLSLGAGYDLFNEKAELSFHIGYVPESLGGELTMAAIKFHYKPFNIPVGDKILIKPFNPVFFPSYTIGENFDLQFDAPQYRKGYYFWSSALRLHLGASTEIKLLSKPNAKIKDVSIYAEANTNDLYAISWFRNRTSSPFYKMFRLGYGVKLHF